MSKRVKAADETTPAVGESPDKAVFQVRMNGELHAKLKSAAEQAGTSLNQLIQDVCQACVDHMHVGKATQTNRDGKSMLRDKAGFVFFGKPGVEYGKYEREEHAREGHEAFEGPLVDEAAVGWFELNYSGRSYKAF